MVLQASNVKTDERASCMDAWRQFELRYYRGSEVNCQ